MRVYFEINFLFDLISMKWEGVKNKYYNVYDIHNAGAENVFTNWLIIHLLSKITTISSAFVFLLQFSIYLKILNNLWFLKLPFVLEIKKNKILKATELWRRISWIKLIQIVLQYIFNWKIRYLLELDWWNAWMPID